MRPSPSAQGGDVPSAPPRRHVPATEVRPWHVAVVQASDGIRFVAAASTHAAAVECVAEYVAARAAEALWEPDAEAVHRAMHRGDFENAVARYFRATGKRWDVEQLSVVEWTGAGSHPRLFSR